MFPEINTFEASRLATPNTVDSLFSFIILMALPITTTPPGIEFLSQNSNPRSDFRVKAFSTRKLGQTERCLCIDISMNSKTA